MKVKIIKGNLLSNVEKEINNFIEYIKVEDIKFYMNDKEYIFLIMYYDLV